MKIASWNVNSIKVRAQHFNAFLKTHPVDVLMLQELKCETAACPQIEGYTSLIKGQKTYNGIALFSKYPIKALPTPFDEDEQARCVMGLIEGIKIICIYAPNGNPIPGPKYDYKLAWLKTLKNWIIDLLEEGTPFLIGGDFNIIPEAFDVADPHAFEQDALFQPEVRALYRAYLNLGLTDAFRALHPHLKAYSFWDYQQGAWQKNEGLRIDHFLVSPPLADRLKNCDIDKTPRGWEQPSDHTPIILDLLPPQTHRMYA